MGIALISKDAHLGGGWCVLIIYGIVSPHTQGEGAQLFSYILPSPPITAPIATWHLVAELSALLGKFLD